MLSLCMIVRNEEANLPRVLGSVQGLVDEMVIVDTGSTDGTIEAAESWGARVDRIEWQDDFAAARNRSLSLARGDWLLVLDGDDEFEREDIPLARELLRTTDQDGLLVRQECVSSDRTVILNQRLVFLRNRPDLRYIFRIHEFLPLDPARRIQTAIRIRHHGYTEDLMPRKKARNLRLLDRMRSDPDPQARVAAQFYLGAILESDRRIESALHEYEIGAYSGVATEFRLYCVFGLARTSAALGDLTRASALYRQLVDANPGMIETELGFAETLLLQGSRDEARAHYERAVSSDLQFLPTEHPGWESEVRRRLQDALGPPCSVSA